MDLYEIKHTVDKIDNDFFALINEQELANLKMEIDDIEKEMLEADFYNNQSHVKKVTTILSANRNKVNQYGEIKRLLIDIKEYLNSDILEEDSGMLEELNLEIKELVKKFNELEISILLNEKYDKADAILDIHCGAGGTESQDWVEMLYKMYIAFLKNKDYKIELLDVSYANDIGIKSITIKVTGLYAYGLLKNEKGVHRLIRISPFDSSSKRHTTFALVSVSPVLDEVEDIVINDSDLEIDTYRSSGAGGQSVNTTDSAVRILHKPTKIVVTCQNQRSQLQNKQEALNVLKSKLMAIELEKKRKETEGFKDSNIDVNFGSQIRTYVFHPYAMVKDHRSNIEVSNPNDVLSGDLEEIINSVLIMNKGR